MPLASLDLSLAPPEGSSTADVLSWAVERFPGRVTFALGFGREGCALLHMIASARLPIDVFTLDTGLLFPESYALWRRLEERLGVRVRAVRPALTVREQAARHGERLWEGSPDRCCEIRKVEPLRRELSRFDAWISAIRRDQTPDRAAARPVERDGRFGLVKISPLLAWSEADVTRYLASHDVPVNALHERGYPSIGCWPCTSRVAPGEDPRAGRWRGRAKTECGLHSYSRVRIAPEATKGTTEMTQRLQPELVAPHGGSLVDRFVHADEVAALHERARALPRLTLDARELADLELLATGAASPLTGFLGPADHESVVTRSRLADGTVWPLPFTLAVPDELERPAAAAGEVALADATGRLWGTLRVDALYRREPREEALGVYGTDRADHPGVAYLLSRPTLLAGGPVKVLPLPELPFAAHRLTPAALRERISSLGWRTVAGFQTRNPIHRAHEHLTKLALEVTDGLVLHPLVGETKGDDVPAAVRFRTYETLLERYYPRERTLLAAFPAAMRYAGPREALFHALARKNYGITHLIVGRDHAGVGDFYKPTAAQEIFDAFTRDEIGVAPLRLEPTFYCRRCGSLASPKSCPHDAAARLQLSGTRVRQILAAGGRLPAQFTRPETAAILREHYASVSAAAPAPSNDSTSSPAQAGGTGPAPARAARQRTPGFVLWLTGLSGAGKSTLAAALRAEIEEDVPVEVLDGDEVRTHLSKGLGFSKEDRDTNIRRIAWVATVLARNGVAVLTAAISPYRDARAEARALAAASGVPFVEVFVKAPLETLVERDVKGLYRKALAGEIAHFTGVSDPYEEPESPEVLVDSSREAVDESVESVLSYLRDEGLLEAGDEAEERVA